VPILATHWGLQTYGAWLIIFTFQTNLAFADFGFAAAAANDMTVSVARGDRAAAIETFHAVRAAMAASVCVLIICAAAVYCIPAGSLAFVSGISHEQARQAILMLAHTACFPSRTASVLRRSVRSANTPPVRTFTTASTSPKTSELDCRSLGGNIEAAAATYLLLSLVGIVS